MRVAFILGLAGAGKSWVTYSLYEWFKNLKQRIETLNLDPGVQYLPYTPSIDIREYINVWNIMEKYNVGPNGGLIISMDLLTEYIEKLNYLIEERKPELLIVDTPGQMEIFAYRTSGKILIENLAGKEKLIVFVMDAVFIKDPRNFISNYLVGGSVKARFNIPMIAVLNKIDLLSDEDKNRILKWIKKPFTLKEDLEKYYPTLESDFLYRTYLLLRKYNLFHGFIDISAMYYTNFSNFVQALTRVLSQGEEYFEY